MSARQYLSRSSEPSSPRSSHILRQSKLLTATTDEFARLWQQKCNQEKAAEDELRSRGSLSLSGGSALASFVLELSRSNCDSGLASSVVTDLSDLLVKPVDNKRKRKTMRPRSKSVCVASTKYSSPSAKETAESQKLTAFFGLSKQDVEFSDKYRKLIRTFGQDFPSHAAVLGMLAEKKKERDFVIHRAPKKIYNDDEISEAEVRQRKKLESLTGLTKEDYGHFMVQLKLFHKLGEHVPLEELRAKHGRAGRSASLPPELLALDANASKVERMLGTKKEVIAGQTKARKASQIFGEQLPQDYCEELAKLDSAPVKIKLHSRKISQPITQEEMKQATRGVSTKKRFGKSSSPKKAVGAAKKAAGGAKKERGLSIMGTKFKGSAVKGKEISPVKAGVIPVKGPSGPKGKPLRR